MMPVVLRGVIKYHAAKRVFVAKCSGPRHGLCVNWQEDGKDTCEQSRRRFGECQGPLGVMVCWLGVGHNYSQKAAHTADFVVAVKESMLF